MGLVAIIAVDPWFLVSAAPNSAKLIRKAREVNNSKISWVETKIQDAANQFLKRMVKIQQ